MGDSEAKSDFPRQDQRAAFCNATFERSQKKSAAEFLIAKAACCELHKVDIPEVQAVIRLLSGPAAAELRQVANDVLSEVADRLDALSEDEFGGADIRALVDAEDRDELLAALVASLFLLVTEQIQGPFSPRFRALMGNAVDSLLDDGAASLGLSLTGSRRAVLRQAAISEIETLLRGSILSREVEIRAAMETALTSLLARREMAPLEIAALGPRPAGEPPRARQEVEEDIRQAISGELDGEGALPAGAGSRAGSSVDGWAYRWYTIGGFVAGLQQPGAAAFRAVNNPPIGPDESTTLFCRWVHERIIPVTRARAQVDRHVALALSGDFDGLVANWPFLDSQTARGGAEDEFASFLRRVGLPPYHHGCRTTIEVVLLADL